MERRTFLTGTPTAANDAYTLSEDQTLTTQTVPDSLHLDGDGGLYSGSHTWTKGDGVFVPQFNASDGSVHVDYAGWNYPNDEWWSMDYAPPTGQTLHTGTYANATKYGGQTAAVPGLDIYGDGYEYTRLSGSFTILQFQLNPDNTVARFAADFSLSTGMAGSIRYHYDTGVLANDAGSNLTATLATSTSHGSLSFNPDGTFTYTPAPNFFGTDSFSYTVSDGVATSPPAVVILTVQGVNDPPSFTKGSDVVADEDSGPHAFDHWATNISPGPGEAGQAVTFAVQSNSHPEYFSQGPAIDPATGRLTFTPAPNAHGVATVTVVLTDDGGLSSDPQSFTITLNNTPDPPVAAADSYELVAGQAFHTDPAKPLTYLLLRGAAGDPITGGSTFFLTPDNAAFDIINGPNGGLGFTADASNSSTSDWVVILAGPYAGPTPPGSYLNAVNTASANAPLLWVTNNGTDPTSGTGSFTVFQNDLDGGTRRFSADFVQYAGGASAPLRGSIRYNVIQGSVLANDTSDTSSPLRAALVTSPAHGTLTFSPDGTFTYTPNPGFSGVDSFTYAASDGPLTSAPATVTLTVLPDPSATLATGTVQNTYPASDGSTVTTPLAGWTVYEDRNANGVHDDGEPTAVTGLDGTYVLRLAGAGNHVVRAVPHSGWSTPSAATLTLSPATLATSTLPAIATSMTSPVVIDVAAFYAGGTSQDWVNHIQAAFRQANAVFANSDTNVRLNLVGGGAVSYTPAGDLRVDLTRLANPSDGQLDTIPVSRNQLSADVTVLFIPYTNSNDDVGLAYILNPAHPDPTSAYAVVAAVGDVEFDGDTLAHEIGHVLGADHDIDNGPQSSVPYARGYRFTGTDDVVYRDVMSYAPGTVLPFFSSPNLSYAGHALGDAATADNARVVRDNAYAVASYRGPRVSPPDTNHGPPAPPPPPVTTATVTTTKSPAKPGATLRAAATVRNTSAAAFTGKATVAFYLSKDKTLDMFDTLLKRTTLNAKKLKPKATLSTSATFKLDPAATTGTYYVLAVATTTGQPADERSAKSLFAALKVVVPPPPKKKPGKTKSIVAAFQVARPIVGLDSDQGRDDRDDDGSAAASVLAGGA